MQLENPFLDYLLSFCITLKKLLEKYKLSLQKKMFAHHGRNLL